MRQGECVYVISPQCTCDDRYNKCHLYQSVTFLPQLQYVRQGNHRREEGQGLPRNGQSNDGGTVRKGI